MRIRENHSGLMICRLLAIGAFLAIVEFQYGGTTVFAGSGPLEAVGTLAGRDRLENDVPSYSTDAGREMININGIDLVAGKSDWSGRACIAMDLRSLGRHVGQDSGFGSARLDPSRRRGGYTKELGLAVHRIGFEAGPIWFPVNFDAQVGSVGSRMLLNLSSNIYSVVCRVLDSAGQFVLDIGYDPPGGNVIVHDSHVSNRENEKADRVEFLRSCRLSQRVVENSQGNGQADESFVRIRLAANDREIRTPPNRFTDADFALHIQKLKKRLPNGDFKIVLQKPFVVVGDAGLSQVKRSATATVKWAVDSIKKDFFTQDPNQIIDIWLFKDAASYKKHNKILFDTVPGTPFGYYSPTHRALIMDISTGGGTLVHEIVHPFIESNFSECPSWFNEGLASLYEQSSSRGGHIVGLTNWRLRGLQLALEDDRVPAFKELCSTSRREFYDGKSTNYAQARYLCYYLQENDLLIKFYHAFRKNVKQDPTGYETLQKVLGRTDMGKFQGQWRDYVLKLRF